MQRFSPVDGEDLEAFATPERLEVERSSPANLGVCLRAPVMSFDKCIEYGACSCYSNTSREQNPDRSIGGK